MDLCIVYYKQKLVMTYKYGNMDLYTYVAILTVHYIQTEVKYVKLNNLILTLFWKNCNLEFKNI